MAPLACDWYATGVWGATSGLSLSTISGGTTQGGRGGRLDGDRERGEAGYGGAVGRNPLSRPAPARATHRRPETLAQAQQMGPWLAYVRWPIGKYLDNDVEDGPGDI